MSIQMKLLRTKNKFSLAPLSRSCRIVSRKERSLSKIKTANIKIHHLMLHPFQKEVKFLQLKETTRYKVSLLYRRMLEMEDIDLLLLN